MRIGETAIESSDDLVSEIALLGPGIQVEIELVRGDETIIVDVLLDERPAEDVLAFYEGSTPADQPESVSTFGITVGPITPIVAQHLGLNSTDGVVIMDVAAGSRARIAGLAEGDIIVEVDHEPIVSVKDWNEAVAELDESTRVVLTVLRNGRLGFVSL